MVSQFLRALFIETLQNLPLWCGFIVGLALIQGGARALGVGLVAGGMVAGGLVVSLTEHHILGKPWPYASQADLWRHALGNIIVFGLVALVAMVYFSTGSVGPVVLSWRTDLVLGVLLGYGIAVGQHAAYGFQSVFRHGLVMAMVVGGTLLLVRALGQLGVGQAAVASALLALVSSVIIVVLEYVPLFGTATDAEQAHDAGT